MQTKLKLLVLALAAAGTAVAAPLTATTAVHTRPDEGSPAITYLKAGTEPTVAQDQLASSPAGWLAVELPGPFEGYVPNKDVLKSLDVRPGANLLQAPKPDAGVITTIDAADKVEITGLHGRWTQVSVEKPLVGYIHLGVARSYAPPVATTSASPAAPPPMAPAPVAPVAYGTATAGHAAPVVALNDSNGPMLPRLFQGKFVSTRHPLRPRRPYDWAVNDNAGERYAYLDISKLLLTDQIENYVNHMVVVYGAAKPVPGTKDIVILVESLQLK
jgi:hypothetical protein